MVIRKIWSSIRDDEETLRMNFDPGRMNLKKLAELMELMPGIK